MKVVETYIKFESNDKLLLSIKLFLAVFSVIYVSIILSKMYFYDVTVYTYYYFSNIFI